MAQLPRVVALKSKYNNKYLCYLNENPSAVHRFLKYSGEEILTPYTKFEFEPAKCDPSLFHIRCCYNNKYWCSLPSDHHYIVAGTDQKEEDKTKWTCTLFRPSYDNDHQSYRFCHVYLGFNVVLWRVGPPYGECLRAQWSDPDKDLCDLSIVSSWESLISLPKYVAFKGDNGSYLSAIDGFSYMQFISKNIEDLRIQMETDITKDGRIRIKSIYWGKFWRRGPHNWIYADSTDTTTQNLDTLFSPTQVVNSTLVALRNLGNNHFVKRYTYANFASILTAATKDIDPFSHLQIIELLFSREIYDVIFHLFDARIRDQDVQVVASGSTTNNTKLPNDIELNVSYTESTFSTWTSSISTKLDVKTTLESKVPRIDGKEIKISETRFSGKYKWGETITTSKTARVTYQIIVPPMSTTFIKIVATKATCDIPFSYKQRDILINTGKAVEYSLDDGVYYGTNYSNLSYELETKPI